MQGLAHSPTCPFTHPVLCQGVDIFLTLVGFDNNFASSTQRIVPAFPAVYGGYVYSAGAEFFAQDMDGDGDVSQGKKRTRMNI